MTKKRYTKTDYLIMLVLAVLASPLASLVYALYVRDKECEPKKK